MKRVVYGEANGVVADHVWENFNGRSSRTLAKDRSIRLDSEQLADERLDWKSSHQAIQDRDKLPFDVLARSRVGSEESQSEKLEEWDKAFEELLAERGEEVAVEN